MGLSITSHQSRPVHREDYRKVLQPHIVDQLIIASLKEGRINGKHRFHASCRQTGRKGHSMFFRDAHVEKPIRKHSTEPRQPGSIGHSRGDRHQVRILSGFITQHFSKYICISVLFVTGTDFSCLHVKRSYSVELIRRLLRRSVSFAFLRQHMQQDRAFDLLSFPESPAQHRKIMARHRSQICDPHVFKEHPRHHKLFDAAFGPADLLDHRISHHRNLMKGIRDPLLQSCVKVRRPKLSKVPGHASHIFRDRHVIIIEDNNKIRLQMSRVVQRLIGHPAGQGPVSDHRDHPVVLSL